MNLCYLDVLLLVGTISGYTSRFLHFHNMCTLWDTRIEVTGAILYPSQMDKFRLFAFHFATAEYLQVHNTRASFPSSVPTSKKKSTTPGSTSHIIFTARPQNVSPVLTSTLHLHCSLKIGELLNANLSPLSKFLKLPLKSQPDVLHVVSIIIYKFDNVTGTNRTIASVTPFDPASAETSNTGEVIITGNTQRSAKGEQGYLEVNKISPNDTDAGTYVCQVSALNYAKYPVSFQASQEVTALKPTVADFVQYVETNNKNIAELKQDIAALTSTIARQKIEHIQTGLQQCAQTSPDAFIPFPVPFNSTPRVITALTSLSKTSDPHNRYFDTSIRTQVSLVNTTGFRFSCVAPSTSFSFSWVAIGDQTW